MTTAGEALAQLEYLNVQGDVSVTEVWKGLLLEKATQISGDTELGVGDILKGVLGGAKELLDTKVINAGDYVL